MNIEKVQAKIQKAINTFPSTVDVKRAGVNEFKEAAGETDVCTVTGFFHTNASRQNISLNINMSGRYVARPEIKLLVVLDDDAKLIQENDYFELHNKKYRVVDPNPQYDIYADLVLEEM